MGQPTLEFEITQNAKAYSYRGLHVNPVHLLLLFCYLRQIEIGLRVYSSPPPLALSSPYVKSERGLRDIVHRLLLFPLLTSESERTKLYTLPPLALSSPYVREDSEI
ncbi:hypothetical protein Avbf_10951 [Armadillidium vulgare]|nr:hypothetical protein Avbf_10951 [Armadillidium vulgare]